MECYSIQYTVYITNSLYMTMHVRGHLAIQSTSLLSNVQQHTYCAECIIG